MKTYRIANLFAAIALLFTPLGSVAAATQNSTSVGRSTSSARRCDPVLDGLWAGVNLDVTQLGRACVTASRPSTSTTKPSSPSTTRTANVYAALGDSIAAGQGLPPSDLDTRCDRSSQAYPYKVAKERNLKLIHAACSGATVGDLVTSQGVSGPNIRPQLDTAFAGGTPRLVTITAGANDVEWFNFLRKCYSSTCGTEADEAITSGLRGVLRGKLFFALLGIQERSNGSPPTVVITGYYNPFSARCTTLQSQLTASELSWIAKQVTSLNQALKEVSSKL
jgi:lysophospholipase L1-like esterase